MSHADPTSEVHASLDGRRSATSSTTASLYLVENSPVNALDNNSLPGTYSSIGNREPTPQGDSPFIDATTTSPTAPHRRRTITPVTKTFSRPQMSGITLDCHSLYNSHNIQTMWRDTASISPARAARYPYWNVSNRKAMDWATATCSPSIQSIGGRSPTQSHVGMHRDMNILPPTPSHISVPSTLQHYRDAPPQPPLEIPSDHVIPPFVLGDYIVDSSTTSVPDLALESGTPLAVMAGYNRVNRNLDKFSESPVPAAASPVRWGGGAHGVPPQMPPLRSPNSVASSCGVIADRFADVSARSLSLPCALPHVLDVPVTARPVHEDADDDRKSELVKERGLGQPDKGVSVGVERLTHNRKTLSMFLDGATDSLYGCMSPFDANQTSGIATPVVTGVALPQERSATDMSLGVIGGVVPSPGFVDAPIYVEPRCPLEELVDLVAVVDIFVGDAAAAQRQLPRGSTSSHTACSHALASMVKLQKVLRMNLQEEAATLLDKGSREETLLDEAMTSSNERVHVSVLNVQGVFNVLAELQSVVCRKQRTAMYLVEALRGTLSKLSTALEAAGTVHRSSTTTSPPSSVSTPLNPQESEAKKDAVSILSWTMPSVAEWLLDGDNLKESLNKEFPEAVRECVSAAIRNALLRALLVVDKEKPAKAPGGEEDGTSGKLNSNSEGTGDVATDNIMSIVDECVAKLMDDASLLLRDCPQFSDLAQCFDITQLPTYEEVEVNFSNLHSPCNLEWWYNLLNTVTPRRQAAVDGSKLVASIPMLLSEFTAWQRLLRSLSQSPVQRNGLKRLLTRCATHHNQCRTENMSRIHEILQRIMRRCAVLSASSPVLPMEGAIPAEMMYNCFSAQYISVYRAMTDLSGFSEMGQKDLQQMFTLTNDLDDHAGDSGSLPLPVRPPSLHLNMSTESMQSLCLPAGGRYSSLLSVGCTHPSCRFCRGEVRKYYAVMKKRIELFQEAESAVTSAAECICRLILTIAREVEEFPHMPTGIDEVEGRVDSEPVALIQRRSTRALIRLHESLHNLVQMSERTMTVLQKL